jgi:hypothetical protein
MRNAPYLAVALLASSCGASQAPQPDRAPQPDNVIATRSPSTPPVKRIALWDASGCGDDQYQNEKLERHPALMGLSPSVLIAVYGAPSASENFVAGEPVGTFYGAYGKQASGVNTGKPMRLLTWTKKSCNFSVFFMGQDDNSRVVEAFEWAAGADF